MLQVGAPQGAAPFHEHLRRDVAFFECGRRGEEIPRIGQTIRPDGAPLGQRESPAIVLADVATCRPIDQLDTELDTPGDDYDLTGLAVDDPKFGREPQ